jgi:site-specific recombinase XerD
MYKSTLEGTMIDKIEDVKIVRSKSDWLNWLRIDHSAATVETYAWQLHNLERAFPDRDVLTLSESDLLAYLAERRARSGTKEEQLSAAAVKSTVNALRSFYSYVGLDVAAHLPMPTPKIRLQRTLNFEQSLAVLSACDSSTPIGKRNLALIALMLDSGLRVSEVCRLEMTKINLANRVLYVVVKNGHEEAGVFNLWC